MDWLARNCNRCFRCKLDGDWIPKRGNCKLEHALSFASVGDGTIPREVAKRIGVAMTKPNGNLRAYEFLMPDCQERQLEKPPSKKRGPRRVKGQGELFPEVI